MGAVFRKAFNAWPGAIAIEIATVSGNGARKGTKTVTEIVPEIGIVIATGKTAIRMGQGIKIHGIDGMRRQPPPTMLALKKAETKGPARFR